MGAPPALHRRLDQGDVPPPLRPPQVGRRLNPLCERAAERQPLVHIMTTSEIMIGWYQWELFLPHRN